MNAARSFSISGDVGAIAFALALACLSSLNAAAEPTGSLTITIKDGASGAPVPARVEIRGADGAYYVAEDALRYVGDCGMSDPGSGYVDQAAALARFSDRIPIDNPYTRSTQFYSAGKSTVRLPAGPATIKVYRGSEYKVSVTTVEIPEGDAVENELALLRWVDMPKMGWYSADDHLHIARPTPELNPTVSRMMQAEDIHVANLLQMGKVKNFTIAQQYAHGPEGHYQDGNYILAAGQENPRTHFLGHTITLGAARSHHDPENYLIYRLLWQETVKEGALNGFAHAAWPHGSLLDPEDGMAIVMPHDLMHFVEVLQFDRSGYERWYDVLTLGFRVAPTAGTDYPCGGQLIPGHERFYTKVEGPLTYAKWLESVRQGRTFVTTGPVIEFRINGQDIGSEIVLEAGSTVEIAGSVTFDPERDHVAFVELVKNGVVTDRFSRIAGSSRVDFAASRRVEESSWFAVRGYGIRLDESTFADPIMFSSLEPTTHLHSAPIYVLLKNRPAIGKSARSKAIARAFLSRLNDLEKLLAEENAEFLASSLATPNFDAVPRETFLNNRPKLLKEIQVARRFFEAMSE